VPYHAYSAYIQTSNQATRDQKPLKKVQTTSKPRKIIQKLKNFHKKYAQKGYMTPPTPKSHSALIRARRHNQEQKYKNTKQKNLKKT